MQSHVAELGVALTKSAGPELCRLLLGAVAGILGCAHCCLPGVSGMTLTFPAAAASQWRTLVASLVRLVAALARSRVRRASALGPLGYASASGIGGPTTRSP